MVPGSYAISTGAAFADRVQGRMWSVPPLIGSVLSAGCLARLDHPELRTGDLLLRPWTAGDVDAVVARPAWCCGATGDPSAGYRMLR